MSTPPIGIRGIRQTLPNGYVVGRVSGGNGQAELISFANLGTQLIHTGVVAPGNTNKSGTSQLFLSAMSAPPTPSAGKFVIYMDVADSKLKVRGPSGTITVIALP